MISSDFLFQFKSIFPLIYVWGRGGLKPGIFPSSPYHKETQKMSYLSPLPFPRLPFLLFQVDMPFSFFLDRKGKSLIPPLNPEIEEKRIFNSWGQFIRELEVRGMKFEHSFPGGLFQGEGEFEEVFKASYLVLQSSSLHLSFSPFQVAKEIPLIYVTFAKLYVVVFQLNWCRNSPKKPSHSCLFFLQRKQKQKSWCFF